MNHRFVIGIGSQRAGSTLLHALLAESTDVFMHPLKELHYFDTIHGVRPKAALQDFCQRQLAREVDRLVRAKEFGFIDDTYRCYMRSCNILGFQDIARVEYRDLFRPFLMHRGLLGEATPEYMLLDPAGIEQMRQVVGGDATILLVCRHPVERLRSAVKLMNVYNGLGMDEQGARAWLRRMLDEETPWMKAQDAYNDYETAIGNYAGRFPRFLAISFGQLLQAPRQVASRIGEVAGIEVDAEKFAAGTNRVKNDLGETFDLGSELIDALSSRYAEQIRFLERTFKS